MDGIDRDIFNDLTGKVFNVVGQDDIAHVLVEDEVLRFTLPWSCVEKVATPIKSVNWQGAECILVNEITGAPISEGDVREDFRGDPLTITGGTAPHKPGASGYITTDHGRFYAGVAGCMWIHSSAINA